MILVLLMTFVLCVPAAASDGIMRYVIDDNDLLTYEEWDALEDRAANISRRYACGVYILSVDDYTEYAEGDAYDVARQIFEYPEDPMGEGNGRDGILLLLSTDEQDWALFVNGRKAEAAFDSSVQSAMCDQFLPVLGEGDWYGGFSAYLNACDKYLVRAQTGTSAQASTLETALYSVLTAVGISCLISLLICLILKGKMKSVRHKSEAMNYTTADGLQLTEKYDRYTHTTETVRHIEKASSGGNKSGSSGKF